MGEKKKFIVPLRVKLLISVVGVVLLFLSFSTYYSIKQTGTILQEQIHTYGTSMARTLADFCIEDLLSWNYPALQLSVEYIGAQDPQILGITIYHQDAEVAEYISTCCGQGITRSHDVFQAPVVYTDTTVGEKRDLGLVEVYLSKESYEMFLMKEIRLLLILSLILLVGDTILSYLTVKFLILNPLRVIMKGTKIIGEGDFDHVINISNKDEIGDLAETVNQMSRNLKVSQQKIHKQTANLKNTQKILINTLQDTEESKKKIEEEQNKTFAIISNLVDPVIVINNKLQIVLVNPSAKKTLGINDSDIGKKIVASGDEDCLPDRLCLCDFHHIISVPYRNKVLKVNERNYPIVEELTLGKEKFDAEKLGNNTSRVYKVFTSPVKDERGVLYGHMKIFYDLTREKIVDQLKSEFISIAAHQLRTPSSGVKWSLQMILDGELGKISDEARDYIKKAYQANERMVNLINDLLNVSRLEAGKFVYNFENVDIVELAEEIIFGASISAQEKNIKLNLVKPKSKLPKINIDKQKIKLSLNNLVNNAIKYSKQNGQVDITVEIDPEDGKYMRISVKDDGIGISEKDQKRLFSKFFRGENAIRLQTEGSGMGLFILKNVVEAHKGSTGFKSVLEKGSTFYVKLPLDSSEPVQQEEDKA